MTNQILLLGGTNFIGRNLVERLMGEQAYSITIANRGITQPDLFPNLNTIQADRETDDIEKVFEVKWDYIIDLSCYYPGNFSRLLHGLKHKPRKYIYVSTCSVYDNAMYRGMLRTESAPLLPCSTEQYSDASASSYGNRKAECERILTTSGLNHVILRPALVFGKYDATDRLYFWLYALKHRNSILLPEGGKRILSLTYVGDLVNSIAALLQDETRNKTMNAISYPTTSIRQLVDAMAGILGKDPKHYSITANALKEKGVSEWSDFPLWLNSDDYTYANDLFQSTLQHEITPLDVALKRTVDYFQRINWPQPHYGMDLKRYESLLKNAQAC